MEIGRRQDGSGHRVNPVDTPDGEREGRDAPRHGTGRNGNSERMDSMTKGFWTSARLAQASRMWNRGDSTADMAKHFGVSRNAIHGMTAHRRDRFPHRRAPAPSIDPVVPEPEEVEPIQH